MGELDEKKAQIAYFEKAIFVLVAIIVALVVWLWEKSFQVLELTATMTRVDCYYDLADSIACSSCCSCFMVEF